MRKRQPQVERLLAIIQSVVPEEIAKIFLKDGRWTAQYLRGGVFDVSHILRQERAKRVLDKIYEKKAIATGAA